MIPFYGTDITVDKNNEEMNGGEFTVQELPESAQRTLERATENAVEILLDARLPLPLRIIEWVTGFVAVVLVMGTIKAMFGEDAVSFNDICENVPWILWAAGGCFVVWLILFIASMVKAKSTLETDESNFAFSKLETLAAKYYKDLGVPDNAETVDILAVTYKEKDGLVVPKERGFAASPFDNIEMKAFVEGDSLMLATYVVKYAIPLSGIRRIETVNKRITVPDWNKDEEPNKGYYKQFKITGDDDEGVSFKPYHILQFRHEGELWGIYFPCYDLEAFERLTGLKTT